MIAIQETPKKKTFVTQLAERILSPVTPIKDIPTMKDLIEVSNDLFHELTIGAYEWTDIPPARKQAHYYLQQLKEVAIEEGEAQVPIYDALQEIEDHYIFAVWFERMIPLL